jgi:hypothetical protein
MKFVRVVATKTNNLPSTLARKSVMLRDYPGIICRARSRLAPPAFGDAGFNCGFHGLAI